MHCSIKPAAVTRLHADSLYVRDNENELTVKLITLYFKAQTIYIHFHLVEGTRKGECERDHIIIYRLWMEYHTFPTSRSHCKFRRPYLHTRCNVLVIKPVDIRRIRNTIRRRAVMPVGIFVVPGPSLIICRIIYFADLK